MAVAPHFHAAAGSLWTGELQESKQGAAWVRLVPQQSATTDVVAMPQQCVSGGFGQGLSAGGMRPRRLTLARGGTGTGATSDGVRWWEKDGGPNFHDVHSTQDFVDALSNAGEKLVVAEFYAPWCGSCRALYPKLCKLAAEHLDVEFVKVNFEENKPMCKSLNIKVLPYFHFYRGAEGRLEDFSCSLSKLHKIRDAIALHNTDRCSLGPPVGAASLFTATGTGTGSDQAAAATASP